MVKKLFKHEISALGRLMFPVLCAVLGVGVFARILLFFESDTTAFRIAETSTFVVLCIAVFASIFLTIIFGIVRYYKNLFSCEGYLSFTLPVTPAQHLWVKSLTAVLFETLAVIASVCAVAIALSGEPISEIWKAGTYLWGLMAEKVNTTHIILYCIEFVVLLFLVSFGNFFLYYTCITIGQTAKKNRVMWAVGVYFIYYIIMQIISTALMIFMSVFMYEIPFEEMITEMIEKHPYAFVHTILLGCIVLYIIWSALLFIVCHTIIRKKLNLE